MLDFRKPVVGDRLWVEKIFRGSGSRGCEYSFATLYLWSDIYRQQVAEFEGDVLERLSGARGPAYLFPAGRAPLRRTLEALAQDAAQRGQSCRLACVTPEQKEQVEAAWPERFQWELDRDGFDYVYEIGRLAELPGKKLQGKRNHINRFLENCPDWTTEEITEKTLPECAEMDREWNRLCRGRMAAEDAEGELMNESRALALAFANYRALGLTGLLLRVQSRVIAFTIGSPICEDTFDVHFEKAFGEIPGAYPMINREFARFLQKRHPKLRYLNREDDLGLEGLRRSKESYHPDTLIEKYTGWFAAETVAGGES